MTINAPQYNLFATTPKGLELLLVDELRSLGAIDPAEKLAGVTFRGDLELAYKACLWSRLANRILLYLAQIPAATPEALYEGVQTIDWSEHVNPAGTLHVNFVSSHSAIDHTLFGAQKVKDAIVDQFRDKFNVRPSVARENADIHIHIYVHRDIATVSLDLSGESLHKRGYRLEQGAAPLKENLAAAILLRAGWKQIATEGGVLLDPMCGSGTLLIEAALIAGDIAPGLQRAYFGFLKWKKHDAALWEKLLLAAKIRSEKNSTALPTIVGYDIDPRAIKISAANIERAGLRGKIHVEKKELLQCTLKKPTGLIVVNPPYGERLGELPQLQKLYADLGAQLKKEFVGWRAALFTGNPDLGKNMGLRARKHYALFNGAIPCQLLLFDVQPEYFVDRSPGANNERRIRKAQKGLSDQDRNMAKMFFNRIQKNVKNLKRWYTRENISCYRLYDADLPEYAVTVDIYNDYVCVQEYPPPKSIDKVKAEQRLHQVMAMLPEALNIAPASIFLRERTENMVSPEEFYSVQENTTTYLINLCDAALPVGLALEQRNLRQCIRKEVRDKRFLNLFSGSGAMTVCAGQGGALLTQSVAEDAISFAWTQRNMAVNQLTGQFKQANVAEWIEQEKSCYDLIFIELPRHTHQLCQEYPEFFSNLMKLLMPQGKLLILNYHFRFKIEKELMPLGSVTEISSQFMPIDFARHSRIYQCWQVLPILL